MELDDDWPALSSGMRSVYCCGEFTWNSLWTVTEPPPEVHDDLINVWEMFPGPISRWRVPILPTACIYEVHTAKGWAQLVGRYPRLSGRPHHGWERDESTVTLASTPPTTIAAPTMLERWPPSSVVISLKVIGPSGRGSSGRWTKNQFSTT